MYSILLSILILYLPVMIFADEGLFIKIEKQQYQTYQPFQLRVRMPKRSYLYLFEIRKNRSAFLLFPNRYQRSHLFPAGEHQIPAAHAKFEFFIDYPTGNSILFALASPQKLSGIPWKTLHRRPIFSYSGEKIDRELIQKKIPFFQKYNFFLSNLQEMDTQK